MPEPTEQEAEGEEHRRPEQQGPGQRAASRRGGRGREQADRSSEGNGRAGAQDELSLPVRSSDRAPRDDRRRVESSTKKQDLRANGGQIGECEGEAVASRGRGVVSWCGVGGPRAHRSPPVPAQPCGEHERLSALRFRSPRQRSADHPFTVSAGHAVSKGFGARGSVTGTDGRTQASCRGFPRVWRVRELPPARVRGWAGSPGHGARCAPSGLHP